MIIPSNPQKLDRTIRLRALEETLYFRFPRKVKLKLYVVVTAKLEDIEEDLLNKYK